MMRALMNGLTKGRSDLIPRCGRSRAPGYACAALLLGVAPAWGQVPVTAVGLGYPVAPIDARAAALGSTGIGLLLGTYSLRNPADLSEHRRPGFGLALLAEDVDVKGGAVPIDTGRERFTVIRAVIPFAGWTASLGFGGELDQDWNARFTDTLVLSTGRVPFEEVREHDGGLSAIDFSLARRLGPLSVGLTAQRLSGSLRQTLIRRFDAPLEGAPTLSNAGGTQRVKYEAWRFKTGASLNVADRLLVSGVVGFTGDLTAEPQDSTRASALFDLPTTLELGASILVTEGLILTGGGGWAGWSSVEDLDEFQPGLRAHDTRWGGVGLEYRSPRLLGFGVPLRIGARRAELPFSFGDSPADETALSVGAGFVFRGGVAELNLAFEFGDRGSFAQDGLEESFRRLTASFTLRQ
jgi:hypothetical protein